jgi:hypothetical protein
MNHYGFTAIGLDDSNPDGYKIIGQYSTRAASLAEAVAKLCRSFPELQEFGAILCEDSSV